MATTAGAAKRFKVNDKTFERRLILPAGEESINELYVGTSPGFRKVHIRPAGEEAVFAAALNSWEINAEAKDWIDKTVLQLDEEDIERIEMSEFVLQRENGEMKVADLVEEEEINVAEARSLLGKLARVRVDFVLGTEAKPEYRQDDPALKVEVARKGGKVLNYRFSKPQRTG